MKSNPELMAFNAALDQILKADPAKVKAEMEADKLARDAQRKTKNEPSARASSEED
jgi:hypothetical protein